MLAASMLFLDASRRNESAPPLARWCLGAGITATIGANLAHGLGHGPIGALVSAWPALALAGSFEMLMTLIRTGKAVATQQQSAALEHQPARAIGADVPAALPPAPDLEQAIRDWHGAGHSQRAIARQLNVDRRKVKRAVTSGLT
jgi:hypothetical protein